MTVAAAQEAKEARVVGGAELRVGRGAKPGEVDGVGDSAGAQQVGDERHEVKVERLGLGLGVRGQGLGVRGEG